MPLDIEVFLQVSRQKCVDLTSSRVHRVTTSSITPVSQTWIPAIGSHPQQPPHYFLAPPTAPPPMGGMTLVMPPSPPGSHFDPWIPDRSINAISRSNMHWGHVAFFYLVEQMHRWERFVFRFDKQFTSMSALKSITGSLSCTPDPLSLTDSLFNFRGCAFAQRI